MQTDHTSETFLKCWWSSDNAHLVHNMKINSKLTSFVYSSWTGLYTTVSGLDMMDEKQYMNTDGGMRAELWFDETRHNVVRFFFRSLKQFWKMKWGPIYFFYRKTWKNEKTKIVEKIWTIPYMFPENTTLSMIRLRVQITTNGFS